MRKILLASSALVAGTAFATAANAGAPELSVSGKINYEYVTESQDDNSSGTQKLSANPFMTELTFDVNAESDSGLKYGGRIELRTLNTTDSSTNTFADEAWIDIAGSFGRVVIGNDDGVGDGNLYNGGSVLVGSYGFTGTFDAGRDGTSQLPGESTASDNTAGNTSDRAKVSYYTPTFGGFQAGVSFTPEAQSTETVTLTVDTTAGSASATKSVDETKTVKLPDFENHVELYAGWNGEVANGVSLGINALYKMADASDTTEEDLDAYEIGAMVSVGDLSISGGYYDNGDSGIAKSSSGDGGEAISFGIAYNFGDFAVSAGYFEREIELSDGSEDSYENISLDVEYTIAEGLSTYAGVQFAEGEDGSAGNTDDATSVIIGTRLRF